MPATLLPPAESETDILRAFATLMSGETPASEAQAALDLLTVAARDGQMQAAVKLIAFG